MADNQIVSVGKKEFDSVQKTKRFWFPTEDASGPGGMPMGITLR